MKAIIYTRFSIQKKGEKNTSCEVQEAYCEEYAAKKDWEVIGSYKDEGRSGADEKRPGLWAAVNRLEKEDVLLVWKLDRLARSVWLMESIKRTIKEAKARIEAVEDSVQGDDHNSDMVRQILSAVAENERKRIALRTKRAMQHHQRQGKVMGSVAPYGYEIEGNLLVEVDEEQRAITMIRALHEAGVEISKIAKAIRKSPFNTRSGRVWRKRDIQRIINNLRK